MTKEYDAKRHCIVITAGPGEVPTVFPITWGLLLGDIVHNYRSSLDHVAWALYKRGRTPSLTKWQEQGIYFPIARERDQFNRWLIGKRPKLPGARRADVAIVRRFQPYITGQRRLNRHVLVVLDDLANADKHRVIQPIQALPESMSFEVVKVTDCTVTRLKPRARRTTLKPGAELVRVYVRKTGPEPDMDVEPKFTLDPAVNERFTFQDWGYTTMRIIAQVLLAFAEPPQTVRTMLGATSHGPSPVWLPAPKR
jgi:hypothetical protein